MLSFKFKIWSSISIKYNTVWYSFISNYIWWDNMYTCLHVVLSLLLPPKFINISKTRTKYSVLAYLNLTEIASFQDQNTFAKTAVHCHNLTKIVFLSKSERSPHNIDTKDTHTINTGWLHCTSYLPTKTTSQLNLFTHFC